ncbi:MAG: ABC transporter permease [Anaerolineales bacterium]|jgi:ABC-2 type transport system permease protein
MSLSLLGAELRRNFRLAKSYWMEYISDFVLYTLGFLLLITVFLAATDNYGPEGYLSSLIGYVVWKICASILVEIAEVSSNESRTGTLEQMFLSGVHPGMIFIHRSVGIILDYVIRGLLLGLGLGMVLGILQAIPPVAIFVFVLTIVGAVGLGFALAGLVMVYKRLDGFLDLTWQMLVFFTGALAPIYNPFLSTVSKFLPLTWGIDSLRSIFLEGAEALKLWQNGLMGGLLLNTTLYVALGVVLFTWGQKRARALGLLAHY